MDYKIRKLEQLYKDAPIKQRFVAASIAKDFEFYEQAIEWFQKLVYQKEDVVVRDKAILELIDIFLNVDGFRSKIQANDLLINVAKEFNPLGPYLLGHYIFYGQGPYNTSIKHGIEWLQRADEIGSVKACIELGDIYSQGHMGVKKDFEKGIEYYSKAANNGDEKAMFNLAICYANKKESSYNNTSAKFWCVEAAKSGCKQAIETLDNDFNLNQKVITKPKEKLIYSEKEKIAMYSKMLLESGMESIYKEKIKVGELFIANKKYQEAIDILLPVFKQKESISDCIVASKNLGIIYGSKEFGFYNPDFAKIFLEYAVVAKVEPEATYKYAEFLLNGNSFLEKNIEEAMKLSDSLIDKGYLDAYYLKGQAYMYEYEKNDKNRQLAINYYEQAAAIGNPFSHYELAKIFIDLGDFEKATDNLFESLKLAYEKDEFELINEVGKTWGIHIDPKLNLNKVNKRN